MRNKKTLRAYPPLKRFPSGAVWRVQNHAEFAVYTSLAKICTTAHQCNIGVSANLGGGREGVKGDKENERSISTVPLKTIVN